MIKLLITFIITIQVSFSQSDVFDEGTQTILTPEQSEEILEWANNSKVFLEGLLRATEESSKRDQVESLLKGIQDIVLKSSPKQSELFLRYSLNRALKLNQILEKESNGPQYLKLDLQKRLLRRSVEFALKYFENDLAYLQKKKGFELNKFAEFSLEYTSFLLELNKSVLDASAHLFILKFTMGLLHFDLARDVHSKKYSEDIYQIHAALRMLEGNLDNLKDEEYLKKSRILKRMFQNLSFAKKAFLNDVVPSSSFNMTVWSRQRVAKGYPETSPLVCRKQNSFNYYVLVDPRKSEQEIIFRNTIQLSKESCFEIQSKASKGMVCMPRSYNGEIRYKIFRYDGSAGEDGIYSQYANEYAQTSKGYEDKDTCFRNIRNARGASQLTCVYESVLEDGSDGFQIYFKSSKNAIATLGRSFNTIDVDLNEALDYCERSLFTSFSNGYQTSICLSGREKPNFDPDDYLWLGYSAPSSTVRTFSTSFEKCISHIKKLDEY